jgi:3-methyladenine DNA glycosylase AlkD
MKIREATSRLKAAGTEQNRKTYGRHGVGKKMYGVSFAELKKLAKEIKSDHELAQKLWATGNHDARVLSTMVADPDLLRSGQIEAWAGDLDNYVIADLFSSLVARSPFAEKKRKRWTRSKSDHLGQVGWNMVASMAQSGEGPTNKSLMDELKYIEAKIHSANNRTRHSMNQALIAIGGRNDPLRKKAIAAARRIGRVQVDHGETSCKTPEAIPYIEKIWTHKAAKAAKASNRK